VPPVESAILEAPTPDSASHQFGVPWLVPLVSTVMSVALIAWIAWWSTDLGGNLDSAVTVVGATVGLCVSVFVAMRLACPRQESQRRVVATVIVGVGLLLSLGAWHGTFLTLKMRSYEPGWQMAVDRALTETTSTGAYCSTSTSGYVFLPGIGRADGRCVVLRGAHENVQVSFFRHAGVPDTGLLFMPDSADARTRPDECLSHLDGPWWQVGWPNGNCPSDWTFVPGG
jgi:hypothetical protein